MFGFAVVKKGSARKQIVSTEVKGGKQYPSARAAYNAALAEGRKEWGRGNFDVKVKPCPAL